MRRVTAANCKPTRQCMSPVSGRRRQTNLRERRIKKSLLLFIPQLNPESPLFLSVSYKYPVLCVKHSITVVCLSAHFTGWHFRILCRVTVKWVPVNYWKRFHLASTQTPYLPLSAIIGTDFRQVHVYVSHSNTGKLDNKGIRWVNCEFLVCIIIIHFF